MSSRSESVSAGVLRRWGLPDPGESKKERGRVIVVGGSRRTPGAVVLAGEAALRVGAGRLGLVVPASVDGLIGTVIPEAAVLALPDDVDEPLPERVRAEVGPADAVLFGPGFDDADETLATLIRIAAATSTCLVLDAFGVGVLPRIDRSTLPERVVVNANTEEAALLLGRELGADRLDDLHEIARRWDVVVNCYGDVVTPSGDVWTFSAGGPGLGTSGSGDVLAGAIAGFAARGVSPAQAAVWGAWTHAVAGDRLTRRVGLGFLARDIPSELTSVLRDVLADTE